MDSRDKKMKKGYGRKLFCPRQLSIFVHGVTRENKHLYFSLGLTGGLLEYKSVIANIFYVSYLIKCYMWASDGREENEGTTCFLTYFIFLMLISCSYVIECPESSSILSFGLLFLHVDTFISSALLL